MKKRLLILAVIVAFAVTTGNAFARDRKGGFHDGPGFGMGFGQGSGFRHLNYLQSELGLTDKQVKQIFDLGTQYREKCFENRNNPSKIYELQTEHRKAVEAVFTKDQLDKLNKFRDDRCRRR